MPKNEHVGWLKDTIEMLYGRRCKEYMKNCACCGAWDVFDTIIQDLRGEL